MKRLLLWLAVLLFASPAFASTMISNGSEPWGHVPYNYANGAASCFPTLSVLRNANYASNSVRFDVLNPFDTNGQIAARSLDVKANNHTLIGSLSNIFANSKTDILPVHFSGGRLFVDGAGGMTVPEPGTLGLLGIGLVFVGGLVRRKPKVG
jgi:PEP-CTERM motif